MLNNFDVSFGRIGHKPRKKAIPNLDQDDDEELASTPEDVKEILGFDPKDLEKAAGSDAKTLYISRVLLNADELIAWAKAQGFDTTLQPGDMHVTVIFSRRPIEWPAPANDQITVQDSSGRSLESFGENGDVIVLAFSSPTLEARWQEMLDAGASFDFDQYRPHVTLTYSLPEGLDLSAIAPYTGPLVFGPEVLAEVDEDWKAGVTEKRDTIYPEATVFKVDKGLGLVFGWAIVCKKDGKEYFDVQGDHIPENSMLKAALGYMMNHRVAKEMHVGDEKGQVVFAWPMTSDIAKAMGIETDRTGLMIGMKPDSPEMLAKFASGEYTGFSIGGRRVRDKSVDG